MNDKLYEALDKFFRAIDYENSREARAIQYQFLDRPDKNLGTVNFRLLYRAYLDAKRNELEQKKYDAICHY